MQAQQQQQNRIASASQVYNALIVGQNNGPLHQFAGRNADFRDIFNDLVRHLRGQPLFLQQLQGNQNLDTAQLLRRIARSDVLFNQIQLNRSIVLRLINFTNIPGFSEEFLAPPQPSDEDSTGSAAATDGGGEGGQGSPAAATAAAGSRSNQYHDSAPQSVRSALVALGLDPNQITACFEDGSTGDDLLQSLMFLRRNYDDNELPPALRQSRRSRRRPRPEIHDENNVAPSSVRRTT